MFIVTILALVAGIFGDPQAPLAQLLDRHAGKLLAFEVVATLISGFLALATDRRQAPTDRPASHSPTQTSAATPHDKQSEGGD